MNLHQTFLDIIKANASMSPPKQDLRYHKCFSLGLIYIVTHIIVGLGIMTANQENHEALFLVVLLLREMTLTFTQHFLHWHRSLEIFLEDCCSVRNDALLWIVPRSM